ncbi:transcription antitermination factor NusG [Azorhizobium sp. AG788]|uniref:transcription termination/antitermination protein NusG n=1 Tax=Azorhizobium sp. AG788 TaxID=2183897 RepID=UPI0010D239DB|nr:transcription termination/antitermination NusG family protein [Azorhizobium sp. AG788]TDT94908.1 transcription antitermination factor NusG [Azorhizobium sp. AG788]
MRDGHDIGWTVVRVVSGKEFHVQARLAGRGYRVWCPWHLKEVEASAGHARYEKTAYYPSYIFVYFALGQSTERVRRTKSVVSIMTIGAEIVSVPPRIMQRLMRAAAEDGYVSAKIEAAPAADVFRVGDVAQVNSGPFADVMGKIAAIDADGEITLWIEAFGRLSPLRLTPNQLREPQPAEAGPVSP